MWGLNLPGTPWATSACRGRPLLYLLYFSLLQTQYCWVVETGLIRANRISADETAATKQEHFAVGEGRVTAL